jgi:hypothetical protein
MLDNQRGDNKFSFLPYLAGRAFLDPEFRTYLLENPEAAASSLGLQLSNSQLENLQSVNADMVDEWMAQFEKYTGQSIMAMSAW